MGELLPHREPLRIALQGSRQHYPAGRPRTGKFRATLADSCLSHLRNLDSSNVTLPTCSGAVGATR